MKYTRKGTSLCVALSKYHKSCKHKYHPVSWKLRQRCLKSKRCRSKSSKPKKGEEALQTGLETMLGADINLEDEALRLLKDIEISIKEVEESNFYAKFSEQIRTSETFQLNLKRVLGSHSHVEMVIYALGSMDMCYKVQHQFAVAWLLKRDFSHWIDKQVEVFDPIFSPIDVIVLKKLGFKVLSVDEKCRRRVEKPTLFYMPGLPVHFYANLMEANWCPSKINQIILLNKNLETVIKYMKPEDVPIAYMQTVESIQKYMIEVKVCENYFSRQTITWKYYSWHFFDVKHHIDMESLIPDIPKTTRLKIGRQLDKEETYHTFAERKRAAAEEIKSLYEMRPKAIDKGIELRRAHFKYRKFWYPTPANWVKLSISGKGSDESSPAGYGGIFYDDNQKSIATFNGSSLGQMDSTAASIEAIKHGFKCLQLMPHVRNLIVVGDDLCAIRCVGYWLEQYEPTTTGRTKLEVSSEFITLSEKLKNCFLHHVYEEANLPAIVLAREGSKLLSPCLWISQQ